MVRGFTIHFFGEGTVSDNQKIEDLAREKGIAVKMHGAVNKVQAASC